MTENELSHNVSQVFINWFGSDPTLVAAPGRINLIGEHTDYNDGFVLPGAIDYYIYFAIAPNKSGIHRFYSIDYDEYFECELNSAEIKASHWSLYLIGVIAQFEKRGISIGGLDCVIGGNIPVGAGLSSSAALECGFASGINKIFNLESTKYELIKIAQKAEHEYAGVMCGIMDQFASINGKKDHVFRLDCRNHNHSYFPLTLNEHMLVLVDTNVKHKLASTEYNKRRIECEEGVSILQKLDPNIQSLRDVNINFLEINENLFPTNIYKRCHYVVSENARVLKACDALGVSNFDEFGRLMYKSHEGLRVKYEVSCDELDILVDATKSLDYVLGSRMMGGGFGGCTINLIRTENKNDFENTITNIYKEKTGIIPKLYFVKLVDGVSIIKH